MRRAVLLSLAGLACAAGVSVAADDTPARPAAPVQDPGVAHVCARHPRVTVHAAARPDAEAACEGAGRALDFLAKAGLEAPPSVTIDIVPELPGALAGRAVGCYVRESRRIVLLDFGAFRAGGGWYRMPPSRELYRAVASHETAHAVVGCHTASRPLPVAAHEYVAYVALFATMDPQLRASLLGKFPGTGFRTAGQVSDMGHLANPNQFGVDAWRHYQRIEDRERWLARVVAGEGVPEMPDDPEAASR